MKYKVLDNCVICNGTNLKEFIDLGNQPLANGLQLDPNDGEDLFPLSVNWCADCGHTQLSVSVNPEILFRDYCYVTGTSQAIHAYFDWFVKFVNERHPNARNILELASNDGTLLRHFKDDGYTVLGVDPARNLQKLAEEKGVQQVAEFWNMKTAKNLNRKFDVIVAQNVLAHVPNPVEFVRAAKESLAPGGKIYLQTSQAEMYKRGEFDTIYHEHLSFFTARSFVKLAELVGLNISHILKMDIHGGSYIVELSEADPAVGKIDYCVNYDEYDYNEEKFMKFGINYRNRITEVMDVIAQYECEGFTVCGFGAAAKGNTFLNAANLSLRFIVDDTPQKQGKFSPGMGIPIKPREEISKYDKLLVVILPWNFTASIVKTVKELRRPGQIIELVTYFPEVKIYDTVENKTLDITDAPC